MEQLGSKGDKADAVPTTSKEFSTAGLSPGHAKRLIEWRERVMKAARTLYET